MTNWVTKNPGKGSSGAKKGWPSSCRGCRNDSQFFFPHRLRRISRIQAVHNWKQNNYVAHQKHQFPARSSAHSLRQNEVFTSLVRRRLAMGGSYDQTPNQTQTTTPRTIESPLVPAPQSKGKGKGKGKPSYRDVTLQPKGQSKGQAKGKNKGKNPIGKAPIGK